MSVISGRVAVSGTHERLAYSRARKIRQRQGRDRTLQLGERGRTRGSEAFGRARPGPRRTIGRIQHRGRPPSRFSRPRRNCKRHRGPRPLAAQVRAEPEAAGVSQYVLGADAVLDLEDIWDYIATDSTDAADRW